MKQFIPILCGGVFFYLLLQTKKPGVSSKEHLAGKSDSFTESDMLHELVKVVNSDLTKTISKSTTSGYKQCAKQFDSLLGKTAAKDQVELIIDAFDKSVRGDYTSYLSSMEKLVEKYIMTDDLIRHDLVRILLDVIREDDHIRPTDLFFICDKGLPLKEKLSQGTELDIYFPAFLLGIWHFCVVNKRDNRVGATTVEEWCKTGNDPEGNSIFKRIITKGHCDGIHIKLVDRFDEKNCSCDLNRIEQIKATVNLYGGVSVAYSKITSLCRLEGGIGTAII